MPDDVLTLKDPTTLASKYLRAVGAAAEAGVDADPEAQITTPITNLLVEVCDTTGIGDLELIREVQLEGSRPDFGALCQSSFRGWVELKKPDTVLDPERWSGHNAKQWKNLAELDNLLLTNGREVAWYKLGELQGEVAPLPQKDEPWNPQPLIEILRLFCEGRVLPIVSVSKLAQRLAPLARTLRDKMCRLLGDDELVGHAALTTAFEIWRARLQEEADALQFADATAQVISYSMVIAALDGGADANGDGSISIAEAREVLRGPNRVLAAALGPVIEVDGLLDAIKLEVGAIERLASGVNAEEIRKRKDPRGEPWLWFYEDFLAEYDPEARKDAGVYYTPIEVVQCITRLIDDVLVRSFDKRLGFADSSVTTLDPACGTGTFPLSAIDSGIERAIAERGPAGKEQAATTLSRSLFGFEILAGPYAVAHLRVSQRLAELGAELPKEGVNILLADTFASPNEDSGAPQPLWGDDKVLADERERARRVKREQEVLVILGNPPYDRVEREASGGWVLHGDSETSSDDAIFAEVVRAANEHTVFSHVASLYNLYSYFWRWAIWKAFEMHGDGPAVVGFITGSQWLKGPGFIGLRELALGHADEILVIDLGGENRGAIKDENVFAIESPVAITLLVRRGRSDFETPARLHYRRVEGSSSEKLSQLGKIRAHVEDESAWDTSVATAENGFVPATGSAAWQDFPALVDLFPWQQPGQKTNRNWPIAPSPDLLTERWQKLLEDRDNEVRAARFVTSKTGRNIHTKVGERPKLADLDPGAEHEKLVRYAWRSFDRQWTFADPRLAKTDSPALWQSVSDQQLFLATAASEGMGPGPLVTVSTAVPDLHVFMGRGGKDIIPIYRDAGATNPNVTSGLPEFLSKKLEIELPSIEDIAAYTFALLSGPRFQERFAVELETAGVRLPLTADASIWRATVEFGREMIWLQSYAERSRDGAAGRGDRVPKVNGLGWSKSVVSLPNDLKDVDYNAETSELKIGDGTVSGVSSEVWNFEVSGMQIVRKWLGYRTAKGTGKAASSKNELDRIRPTRWHDDWNDELLDLLRVLTITVERQLDQASLVDRVCEGELIPANELPKPEPGQREVPKTLSSEAPSLF